MEREKININANIIKEPVSRANGLKIEQYLKYIIEKINKEDVENLLPWSSNLPKELKITAENL